jgi:predicted permease
MHRVLIAGQVALTIVLMAGAGAATKAFLELTRTPLGFDPKDVLSMNVAAPKGANPTWQERLNAGEAVRQAIEQVPGVASASISTTWSPPFGGFTAKFEIQGKPDLGDAQTQLALVSPEIFATLRVPLLRGRLFDRSELMRAAHVALVNQAFVKQFLADSDPIGRFVRSAMLRVEQPSLLLAEAPDDWLQVIGVVADARNDGLDHPTRPTVFLPYSFVLTPDLSLFVRTTVDPVSAMSAIRQRLRGLNAEMVVSDDHPLTWWLDTQGWGKERVIATLFSLFAVLALVLAGTGLYSVVSYAVTRRTQEVGIRMALGAPRTTIVHLVLSSTAAMVGAGVVIGLLASIALSRVVASWTGGDSRDVWTLSLSALILIAVSAVACILPAWNAATIDPMKALRTE